MPTPSDSPFPGPTKLASSLNCIAFDPEGHLWLTTDGEVAIHRRGEKKTTTLCNVGGSAFGLAGSVGVLAASGSPPLLVRPDGTTSELPGVGEVRTVVASSDGTKILFVGGYPGLGTVMGIDGATLATIDHAVVRGTRNGAAFDQLGDSIYFFTERSLHVASASTGAVTAKAKIEQRVEGAHRIHRLGDALVLVHAGSGTIVTSACTVVDREGGWRFAIEGEADAVAVHEGLGLIAVVRGVDVALHDRTGARIGGARRAKKSFVVDDVAISPEGYLALVTGSNSGLRAKSVEWVKLT